MVSRPVIGAISAGLGKLNNDQAMAVGSYAIERLAARQVTFEEEDTSIKKQVAEIHAARKDFDKAARVLERINLESQSSEDERAALLIQIAELWFEDDDAVNAEKFINRAAHVMHLVGDPALQVRFKVCHARIADSKRKFLVAAFSYYQLSNQENVNPEDLLALLGMAATCAILSPAGPQRSRILTVLRKDARSVKLDQFDVLEKMHAGKIIKRPEVRRFEEQLADHQRTVSQEGYSVLEKALIEHNIEVISKIY